MVSIPSPFEEWAAARQYDLALAVNPSDARVYADRRTQEVFDAWNAGAQSAAPMFTESTPDIDAFREKILKLARDA